MKHIPILIIMFCLLSCSEDFLDKTDPSTLVASGFYQTEAQVQQAVNGVYGQLQGIISSQWAYNEFVSDNTTLHFNIGNRGQGPALEAIEFWQMNSGTSNINNLYSSIYLTMVNINTTLSKLSPATFDEESKKQFEGELRFMRAYYYFLLVQYFGEVIIIEEPLQVPSQAYAFERQPVDNVYDLINSDLNFAITALPANYNSANVGRATKGAALTLLGKVQLTRKEYANAVATLKQVLSLGYSLLPSYTDVFDPLKKNHAESIFEVQFQGDNTAGEGSSFIYIFAPLFSKGAVINFPGQDGAGWNIPSRDMIAAYEAGDLRKDVSLKEGYTDASNVWVPVPFINKYNHPHTILGVTNDNWPVLRYADVLLMLAEAINEQGNPTAEAYDYLNAVRTRAGLAALSGLDQASFRDAVLKERRVELAFENHRWFDLKRTKTPAELAVFLNAYAAIEKSNPTTGRGGIPFSAGDYQFDEYEVLFPIPANEIRINPKLTQNPGYN
ncbi:MAG TPA: RagB/SusD family nutrient uptake outer membrane protein [Chryseolinea sp.]|nr:RagB/SusD family nutrient uptake outer membrane protein [Chryseolinea sp.]